VAVGELRKSFIFSGAVAVGGYGAISLTIGKKKNEWNNTKKMIGVLERRRKRRKIIQINSDSDCIASFFFLFYYSDVIIIPTARPLDV
jgi:hypothetical protein